MCFFLKNISFFLRIPNILEVVTSTSYPKGTLRIYVLISPKARTIISHRCANNKALRHKIQINLHFFPQILVYSKNL